MKALEQVLTTPVRQKYRERLQEGYDLEGQSPCFDVYKKLSLNSKNVSTSTTNTETENDKSAGTNHCSSLSGTTVTVMCAHTESQQSEASGLDLLATAASSVDCSWATSLEPLQWYLQQ